MRTIKTKDGIVLRNIPDNVGETEIKQRISEIRNARAPKSSDTATYSPTEGMSGLELGMAGLGKSVVDAYKGAKQLLNIGDQERLQQEIDEAKRLDEPLMRSPAALGGNIAGHVGMSMVPGAAALKGAKLAAAAPAIAKGATAAKSLAQAMMIPKGVASGAAAGGAYSSLMPTASDESAIDQVAMGAAGGALFPAAASALRTGKALVEPLHKTGREAIIGRLIKRSAGQNADDVIGRMASADEIIPGSSPTAAQVSESGGIAALERGAKASFPQEFAERQMAQRGARVNVLDDLTRGNVDEMIASRRAATQPLYAATDRSKAQVDTQKTVNMIDSIIEKNPLRKKLVSALTPIKDDIAEGGTPQRLRSASQNISDLLNEKAGGSRVNETISRELTAIKKSLDNQIAKAEPAFRQAQKEFSEMSRPIDRLKTLEAIRGKAVPAITEDGLPIRQNVNAFANALRNADAVAKKATGFKRARAANVLDDADIEALNLVRKDMQRAAIADDIGRGVGSDTAQKLAMSNVLRSAGVPAGAEGVIQTPSSILNRLGDVFYANADDQMRELLTEALLDPRYAAELTKGAGTPLIDALRYLSPAGVGAAGSMSSQ